MTDLPVTGRTSGLLRRQLVTDLLLVLVEVIESLFVETSLPQNLVLIQQQLTVLIVHLVWRRLSEEEEKPGFNSAGGALQPNTAGCPKQRAKLFCSSL